MKSATLKPRFLTFKNFQSAFDYLDELLGEENRVVCGTKWIVSSNRVIIVPSHPAISVELFNLDVSVFISGVFQDREQRKYLVSLDQGWFIQKKQYEYLNPVQKIIARVFKIL